MIIAELDENSEGLHSLPQEQHDAPDSIAGAPARSLLAAIIESSDDAIVSKNLDGIITSWNQGAERLFGYNAHEAIGSPVTILIPPDRQDEEPRILERLRRGERVDHFETIRLRKDGTPLNVSLTISPVRDDTGAIVGASKIARDVTAQRLAAEALRDSKEELRRLNEELEIRVAERTGELLQIVDRLNGFTYSIAHDLRQSIRGVVINAQMLSAHHSEHLDEEGLEELKSLSESGKRLANLVDDLLSYARTSDQVVRKEWVDFSAMAADVSREAEKKHKDCHIDIQEHVTAEADPNLLRLVLENLIDNACKYRSGDEPAEVTIGRQNGAFYIRDRGIGFESEYSTRIFEPFERLHPVGRYEGSGIGLANVRRVLEKHGGRIWAESEPGKGSTFYFTLSPS